MGEPNINQFVYFLYQIQNNITFLPISGPYRLFSYSILKQDNYTKFNGFVILHGTDTMAYTASALSFMLENLGKPVILTGSQVCQPVFLYFHHIVWADLYILDELCDNLWLKGVIDLRHV